MADELILFAVAPADTWAIAVAKHYCAENGLDARSARIVNNITHISVNELDNYPDKGCENE